MRKLAHKQRGSGSKGRETRLRKADGQSHQREPRNQPENFMEIVTNSRLNIKELSWSPGKGEPRWSPKVAKVDREGKREIPGKKKREGREGHRGNTC